MHGVPPAAVRGCVIHQQSSPEAGGFFSITMIGVDDVRVANFRVTGANDLAEMVGVLLSSSLSSSCLSSLLLLW